MTAALRECDDALLRELLAQALAETRADAEVAAIRRQPFAYETSFAIDALEVELAAGERLSLLAKDVGPSGLSASARTAKPPFTLDPAREIAVYRELLSSSGLATAAFHGASVNPEEERWWLFVERIEGEVLTDVGELSVWTAVAAWAARLGAALAERPPAAEAHLLHRDDGWYGRWIDAAVAVLDGAGGSGPALAERLRRHRVLLLEQLASLPRAFVHGELYPSNVLVAGDRDKPRIAAVDWELAGTGPYALDLAALTSGWKREDALVMCRAFHAALPTASRPPLAELLEAVALCRLSLSLQWIGWAPRWTPPEDHRHDWPAEAAAVLDELRLR